MNRYAGTILALLLGVAVASPLCPTPAATAAPLPSPTEFLRARDAEIQRILAEAPSGSIPGPLRAKLKEQINAAFDFRELSRLALGTYWEGRAEPEREHFVHTFSGIVQERNFDSFVRYYREGRFNYREEKVEGTKAEVRAAVPLKKEEVSVTYRLHVVNGQWRVYDLVIDDVSTAEGNRRQYARYLEKNPYEKLIDQLDRQLARLRSNGG